LSDHLVADHGDRVGYANSVELRYPFLDVNLVEVIKQIPDNLKLNGLNEKYILKQCAKKYLPESIINREKFSFVAPGSTAMLKSNNEWIKDTLSPATIKRQGYFDPETISRIRELYTEPGFGINQTFETDLLMIVLTFSLFMDEFGMPNLN
jgi:asparagine synthase (glutamine-hydrolysing)